MIDKKYSNFFNELKNFREKQQRQKQRGLNDYNLLTTVLSKYDEVRLHSRMIGSLLDVNGLHYQGSLFLEKFVEVLGLEFFDFDVENSSLYLEYKNIDIYLTDGNKHIIVENKLQAGDQKHQISNYLNTIKDENDELSCDDILVVYLSIDRKSPSQYSLHNLVVDDSENFLQCSDNKVSLFKNINYKNEILNWLESCLHEVQNIINLNESIKQYRLVVQKVTSKYKGSVMSLKDFLLEGDNLKIMRGLEDSYLNAKAEIQCEFWVALQNSLQQKGFSFDFVDDKYNDIDINSRTRQYYHGSRNVRYFGLKHELKCIDIDKKLDLSFYIELDWNIYFGFTVSKDGERKNIAKENEFTDISNKILSNKNIEWPNTNKKNETWWICWKYPKNKLDFISFNTETVFNLIDNDKRVEIADALAEEITSVINDTNLAT